MFDVGNELFRVDLWPMVARAAPVTTIANTTTAVLRFITSPLINIPPRRLSIPLNKKRRGGTEFLHASLLPLLDKIS
jgi:hypothetical protein